MDLSGTAAAINALYQTSNLPGSQSEDVTVRDFHGAHLRVKGSGNLTLGVQGLDGTVSLTPAASPLALAVNPGKEYLAKWWARSEQETISLGTNAVDEYFILSLIRAYWTNSLPQR